jgi:hypothetical protein
VEVPGLERVYNLAVIYLAVIISIVSVGVGVRLQSVLYQRPVFNIENAAVPAPVELTP